MSLSGGAGSRKRRSNQISSNEHSRHSTLTYQGSRTSHGGGNSSDSASNGGAYFGFHGEASFFITKTNFVLEQFPVFRNSKTLFFFFEKGDVTGKASHADLKFAHMRKEYRILLKLLLFNAQVFNAHVRLLYLEPTIAEMGERHDLPPSLRCALTSAFCLCVTFPGRPPHLMHDDAGRRPVRGDHDDDDLFGFGVSSSQDVFESTTRRALDLLHDEDANHGGGGDDDDYYDDEEVMDEGFYDHLIFYSKLLACVDLNLISPSTAYVVADDRATAQQVVALYDWKRWKYVPNVLSKRIPGIRFSLDKPFNVGETSITPNALVAATALYFRRRHREEENAAADEADEPEAEQRERAVASIYPESVLSNMFRRLAVPDFNHVYREYKRRFPGSPALAIIEALCEGGDARQSFAVDVTDALVFQYSPEHLICKDDLNLFEQAPLFQYPHVSVAASVARDLPALVEQLVYSPCNGTDRVLALAGPQSLDADASAAAADTLEAKHFDVVWPHLHAYKRALEVVVAGGQHAPLAALRVQYKLFVTVVLKNADKILTQPSNAVFSRARALLEPCEYLPGPFVVNMCKLHYVSYDECRSIVPRVNDRRFFELTFVHCFGLGRVCQAYFTLLHLFHSTSPKWKTNKIMLVNHTRGGTGKTHTVQCIQRLFHKLDGLFRSISTMTDAVLKYAEINVGKMIVLDDVGLSHHQQKNSKKEDSMMPAQLKSLLDTGYTVNDATERDARTRNFKASTKTTVLNAAFVWNTNTTDTFSAALLDRCLVLQSEPLTGAFKARSDHEIAVMLRRWKIGERHEAMLVRHTVVQTLLFTTCARVAAPNKTCDEFVTGLVDGLRRQFPVTKTTNSCLRSGFQLLDMTMAESLRLAVNTVFELWVPPWTVPPAFAPDDSVIDYLQKLDAARVEAVNLIEMHELLVEIMAQAKLFFPSAATQIVCLNFYRATDNVFEALSKLVMASLRHSAKDAVLVLNNVGHSGGSRHESSSSSGHHGAGDDFIESNRAVVVLNYLNVVCSEVFTLDAIVVKSAADILFKHPSGVTLRPVEEVGQAHVKMNAFFLVELLKRYWRAETFEATRERLLRAFRAQLEDVLRQREQGATFSKLSMLNYVPVDDVERNFLKLLSAHREQYGELLVKQCHSGDDGGGGLLEFSVSPALWGIADELARGLDDARQIVPARFRNDESPEEQRRRACEPRMAWFTKEYISDVLLHLFDHSPAIMLPSGNVVGYVVRAGRTPAPERLEPFGALPPVSWEYQEAAAVYRAYECRVDDDLHELQRDGSRYLGSAVKNPESARAQDCAALRELLDGLPSTADEAKMMLSYRYNKSREEIERLGRTPVFAAPADPPPAAAEREEETLSAVSSSASLPFPTFDRRDQRKGMLLWEKLQKRHHTDE